MTPDIVSAAAAVVNAADVRGCVHEGDDEMQALMAALPSTGERIDEIRARFPADMTAGEFAEHLPADLRQAYWHRKISELAEGKGLDPDAEVTS